MAALVWRLPGHVHRPQVNFHACCLHQIADPAVTGRLLAIGVRYSVTDNCHGSNWVSCIAFDPKDNDVLVSGSWDMTLKKWRLSSGDCLATYTGHR